MSSWNALDKKNTKIQTQSVCWKLMAKESPPNRRHSAAVQLLKHSRHFPAIMWLAVVVTEDSCGISKWTKPSCWFHLFNMEKEWTHLIYHYHSFATQIIIIDALVQWHPVLFGFSSSGCTRTSFRLGLSWITFSDFRSTLHTKHDIYHGPPKPTCLELF